MEIQQRAIIVSGGGSGLGAATARRLSSLGANVTIADLQGGTHLDHSKPGQGRIHFVQTDVTDEDAVVRAVDDSLNEFGAIHGLVNCAGIAIAQRILSRDQGIHDLESFVRVVTVNLVGTFNLTRVAAAAMASNDPDPEGERGVIVNTASIAAFDGQIGQVAYAASKGGIVGMTLPLARDLARSGIRVVSIAPGAMDTPLLAQLPERVRSQMGAQVPHPQRLGRPEDFAQVVQHIFATPYLNGETIRLDGAIRMGPR